MNSADSYIEIVFYALEGHYQALLYWKLTQFSKHNFVNLKIAEHLLSDA